MPTVYIETTIPSFYFETRRTAEVVAWRLATRRWWDRYRHAYQLCTSEVVVDELSRAPAAKSGPGTRLLEGARSLVQTPETVDVARFYIEQRLVPQHAVADALHLALASVHGMDYLLTWNCKHLANVNKARHLAVLNTRRSLPIPVIATPLTLLPEIDDEPQADNPG
jgi:predicted nucleic acid-binding protein